jgi:hypothetical protein
MESHRGFRSATRLPVEERRLDSQREQDLLAVVVAPHFARLLHEVSQFMAQGDRGPVRFLRSGSYA